MKLNLLLTIFVATIVAFGQFVPSAKGQDPDNTATVNEFKRREENLGKLDVEDQLKVRAAQQKALEDPEMKAALEQRDKAIREFRAKLREKMVAADPSVKPILDRIAEGADPGFALSQ
jgi:hypothetical protein